MIKSIIVDDEPGNIDVLQKIIEDYCEEVYVAGSAKNVDDAVLIIEKTKPDLVFLDIEMPGKNGFDLINQLSPITFEVIFITAFEHHALRAFKYSAIDYLLKPVSIAELQNAIKRAQQRITDRSFQSRLENYLTIERKKEIKIAVQLKNGFTFVNPQNVICFLSEGAYTRILLTDRTELLSNSSLRHFADLLPQDAFCRIHHSTLVNLTHAIRYSKGRGGTLEMANHIVLEVSQRRREELLRRFKF